MVKFLISVLFYVNISFSQTPDAIFPVISESVNDFEEVLSATEEDDLRFLIRDFIDQKKISLIIVSVKSIEPFETIFDYALELANRNTFGQIYIVFCADKRIAQIQAHDDVMFDLTSDESSRILDQYIMSEFKKGNYFEGLHSGVREISKEFRSY